MTRSTKKKEKNERAETAQLIAVDAGKLSQGLKTAFEGVAMVFDAIGAPADFSGIGATVMPETKDEQKVEPGPGKEEVTNAAEETVDTAGDGGSDAGDDHTRDVPDDNQDDAVTETDPGKNDVASSAVTLDDVTKIIVQKIKQDRGNNQKIGQILKTYGAAKVGELDPKKYEAFLTDLAAL